MFPSIDLVAYMKQLKAHILLNVNPKYHEYHQALNDPNRKFDLVMFTIETFDRLDFPSLSVRPFDFVLVQSPATVYVDGLSLPECYAKQVIPLVALYRSSVRIVPNRAESLVCIAGVFQLHHRGRIRYAQKCVVHPLVACSNGVMRI